MHVSARFWVWVFYRYAIEAFYFSWFVGLYYKIYIVYTWQKLMFVHVFYLYTFRRRRRRRRWNKWLSAGILEGKQCMQLTRGVLIESIVNVEISKSQFETKFWRVRICKTISCTLSAIGGRPSHSNTHTHTHKYKPTWPHTDSHEEAHLNDLKLNQTKSYQI